MFPQSLSLSLCTAGASSSRSGSEPPNDNMEFIMEFEGENTPGDDESWMELERSPVQGGNDSTKSKSMPTKSGAVTQQSHSAQASERGPYPTGIAATRMSLSEKLKQRMRQGLGQTSKSQLHFHVITATHHGLDTHPLPITLFYV